MATVGMGVLGFAHGHVGMYCDRWRRQPELGVSVVAGWDADPARAQASCSGMGIDCCSSAQELLARADVQAVVIACETAYHADIVELAAAAGKPIILQKPIALTLEQADRIVKAVDSSDVPFTLAWQMRVDPHNLQAKAILDSGELGQVYMLRRRHCLSTQFMADFDRSWHVNPELNHDIFADDAAHPLDFVYWILGMPQALTAQMGTLLNPAIKNDNAIVVLAYPNGVLAEVSCTFVAVAGENALEIVCEDGIIVGNYGDGPSCGIPRPLGAVQLKWYSRSKGEWTYSDLPDIENQGQRIAGLAGPLAEFVRGERPPIATAAEGREVLRLVLACYDSVESGRRVSIGQ